MISVEHQLQDMGGKSASNAATNLQTYFGCTVLDHNEIYPTPMSITKGRRKRMKTGVKKAVEHHHAYGCVAAIIRLLLMTVETILKGYASALSLRVCMACVFLSLKKTNQFCQIEGTS